jgi:hypothetical protein
MSLRPQYIHIYVYIYVYIYIYIYIHVYFVHDINDKELSSRPLLGPRLIGDLQRVKTVEITFEYIRKEKSIKYDRKRLL